MNTTPSSTGYRPNPWEWLETIGGAGIAVGRWVADLLYLLSNAAIGFFTFRRGAWYYLRRITVEQIYFTAVQSMPLMAFVGVMLGILTMLPLYAFRISDLGLLSDIVNVVLLHQLTPLVTALVVIGRSGTAITAELGELQANQTIETLITQGIEPHQFLVLPRLLGVTLSLFMLTFWANAAALLGAGYFSQIYHGIPLKVFLLTTLKDLETPDLLAGLLVVFCYGMTIALVHCSFGFRAQLQLDIARRLPRAYVVSASACVLITLLVSVVLYA
ncbi:MAG: ABC transporter permease [Gammaproteobacteria bacterium]